MERGSAVETQRQGANLPPSSQNLSQKIQCPAACHRHLPVYFVPTCIMAGGDKEGGSGAAAPGSEAVQEQQEQQADGSRD